MESVVPTAGPMAPPETDAQPLEPSSSAAKSRGRARKNAKQAVPLLSTCTYSHLPGASRHGLSARPTSLHSPHRNVMVYVCLVCCRFCACLSLQLHASYSCCETQAATC